MHDLDTRRIVLNAIIFGRPLHRLGLPAHVVSWHIIWLHHAGRIIYTPTGQLVPARRKAAA